jgi:hypothetical protein
VLMMLVVLVALVVLGGKGRTALSLDVANVVDCGGVEATLGGVDDEVRGAILVVVVERGTSSSTGDGAGWYVLYPVRSVHCGCPCTVRRERESEVELAVAFFLVWSGLLEGTAGNLFV